LPRDAIANGQSNLPVCVALSMNPAAFDVPREERCGERDDPDKCTHAANTLWARCGRPPGV